MTIVIFIIGISILILIHELGHFLAAKWFGLWVEEFGFGFPPRLFKVKRGETIYSFNLLPFGGFVKIHGEKRDPQEEEKQPERSFWFLRIWRRAVIIAAGVIMNLILGWLVISIIYMIGASGGILVTNVTPETPAAIAGLLEGDRILDFQGSGDFINFVNNSKGEEITFRALRGEEELAFKVVPRVDPPAGQGALGISLTEVGFPQLGVFPALWEGARTSLAILAAIAAALGNLIAGIFTGAPVLEQFVGPVGIFGIASQAASFGLVYLLQLIGLISLNLAVLNIIPIPALDGGRLLFLLFEKIKGAPLHPKREMIANAIGFALLLLLMVVITVRDVAKLF